MNRYLLAIDQGTTGSTALIINDQIQGLPKPMLNTDKSIHNLVGLNMILWIF